MASIKVTCPEHGGNVRLSETDILLVTFSNGEGDYYTFICDVCRREVHRNAPPDIAKVLSISGVEVRHVELPGEILDGDRTGPKLTADDLLDFMLDLYQGEVN